MQFAIKINSTIYTTEYLEYRKIREEQKRSASIVTPRVLSAFPYRGGFTLHGFCRRYQTHHQSHPSRI